MEERIKHLFRKYLTNTCTREEFEEVFQYLQQEGNGPLMQAELRRIYEEELGSQPSEVFVGADGILGGDVPVSFPAEVSFDRPRPAVKRLLMMSAAAAVVVVVTGAAYFWHGRTRVEASRDVAVAAAAGLVKQETKRSEYKYLMLPDSTEVWLDADSRLEFPSKFEAGSRKVVLTGEAFFDVRHADKVPFVIYTGKVTTEVLGTAFNIKAYPGLERITVSVKRGKVKVNFADKPVATLTMGQQVTIGNMDSAVRIRTVVAEKANSWQDGNLSYEDNTIGDIIADLQRVYNTSIHVMNPSVKQMRVSMGFRRKDGVVKALEVVGELTDTQLVIENGQYYMK
jgi:ferric-dicitrate binding protein FerR (iron transport regulator)